MAFYRQEASDWIFLYDECTVFMHNTLKDGQESVIRRTSGPNW